MGHSNSDEPKDAADDAAGHEPNPGVEEHASQDECEADASDADSDDEVGGECSTVPYGICMPTHL